VLADFAQQAVHLGATYFLVSHFAAAMKNHGANLVAFAEEADDLVLANLIIVLRGGGRNFTSLSCEPRLLLRC